MCATLAADARPLYVRCHVTTWLPSSILASNVPVPLDDSAAVAATSWYPLSLSALRADLLPPAVRACAPMSTPTASTLSNATKTIFLMVPPSQSVALDRLRPHREPLPSTSRQQK